MGFAIIEIKHKQLIFIHQWVEDYNKETSWNGHVSMNELLVILE